MLGMEPRVAKMTVPMTSSKIEPFQNASIEAYKS